MIHSGRQLADAGGDIREAAGLCCPPESRIPSESGPPDSCDARADPCAERLRLLVSTVESQIIPRLVISHRAAMPVGAAAQAGIGVRPGAEEVESCVQVLLDRGGGSLEGFVEARLARGVTLDTIYLEIFAPAARRLGDMWTRDECSFTDVTIALGRLQQSLRRYSPHFRPEFTDTDAPRRALFAAVPGEQHTFGLSMIVQYFLRAGWDASILPNAAGGDLMRLVQQEPIALVGLSMGVVSHAPLLKTLISRLRAAACHERMRVLVGGVAFADQPGLAEGMGADGTASDAAQAVYLAQQLVL